MLAMYGSATLATCTSFQYLSCSAAHISTRPEQKPAPHTSCSHKTATLLTSCQQTRPKEITSFSRILACTHRSQLCCMAVRLRPPVARRDACT
eukprot:1159825-Pelagomonas_calceolata.AAC.4